MHAEGIATVTERMTLPSPIMTLSDGLDRRSGVCIHHLRPEAGRLTQRLLQSTQNSP